MASENPYESPTTDATVPQEADSRLRVIPATFLGFFASVAIAFGIWIVYEGSSKVIDYRLNYLSHSGTADAILEALMGLGMLVGGVLAAIATCQLMKNRWRATTYFVACALAVVILSVVSAVIFAP